MSHGRMSQTQQLLVFYPHPLPFLCDPNLVNSRASGSVSGPGVESHTLRERYVQLT